MRAYIVFLIICVSGTLTHGQTAIQEIRTPLIRHTVRIVAQAVYDSTGISIEREMRRGYPGQPSASEVLKPDQLEKFFNDGERSLEVNYNSFEVGKVKGHLFSINHADLNGKIFIGFPGSQDRPAWYKNLFGIETDGNIQGSYKRDIDSIFGGGEMSLRAALDRHIRFRNRFDTGAVIPTNGVIEIEEPINYRQYEYYFIGHSRGGGLALLAAKSFRDLVAPKGSDLDRDFEMGRIKVFTFSSPRLSNAFQSQLDFVGRLGFENIVHFIRPSDVGPLFPFRFVENYGVKIPLVKSRIFFNILGSHKMPDRREIDDSVSELAVAKDIGWMYPISNLFFPIEPKSLVWGTAGFCLGCIATVFVAKAGIIEDVAGILLRRWHKGY